MGEKLPSKTQEQEVARLEELPPEADKQEEHTIQPPQNFDAEINDIDAKIQTESEGLKVAHENLGISSGDDSAALRELRNKREKIIAERDTTQENQDVPSEPNVDAEKQEAEQALEKRLQKNIEQIGDDLSSFGRALQRREDDQLTPLLERDEMSGALSSIHSIRNSVDHGRVDFEYLDTTLRRINRGLENYGQYRSAGPVHEDEENLRMITTFARSASEELYRAQKTLLQSTNEATAVVARPAGNLAKRLEEIWLTTARRLDALSRY